MKQRIAAFLMCVICLLSVVGCGQTKADTNTPSAANQQTVTDDYLTTISGTDVELFPERSKAFKLTNEKGGAKTHFFEQWSYECSLTGGGIIKS